MRTKVSSMSNAIKIMIVEDHAVVRQGLAALLAITPDFTVVAQAADGRQAIEQFRRHQPERHPYGFAPAEHDWRGSHRPDPD